MQYTDDPAPEKLPGTYKEFITKFPELGEPHEQIAKAVESYGPLDRKACELIKIGICVGAFLIEVLRLGDCAVRVAGGVGGCLEALTAGNVATAMRLTEGQGGGCCPVSARRRHCLRRWFVNSEGRPPTSLLG